MAKIKVTRTIELPDLMRINRYRKMPELGPKMLFFSGGSALNGLSRVLKNYTHNSTHLVTPFDSGGSSAELRRAFSMPSIGDLRSRLIALADETILGHPEIYRLFTTRFAHNQNNDDLLERLQMMAQGKTTQMTDIANPMRRLICNHLGYFLANMPADFKLQGASIGNLILAGGYLNNHHHLDPICFLFSKLVNVLGTVRTIVNKDYHLAARLSDGELVIGQHLITGKEASPLSTPIEEIFLTSSLDDPTPIRPVLKKKNRVLIKDAELICFPPGSFYSSLLANLLPEGVGQSIASNDCPKVYIPNLGKDPEQIGMTFESSLGRLLQTLKADLKRETSNKKLVNFILLDSKNGKYPYPIPTEHIKDLGIQLIDMPLVTPKSAPYYDNALLTDALLSLT